MAREKSDVAALLLSIIIPGSGHMYKGHDGTAVVWFIATIVIYTVNVAFGFLLHLACIVHAAITKPADEEKSAVKPDGPVKPQKMLKR